MLVQWLTALFPRVLTSPDRFRLVERMRSLCDRPHAVPGVGHIMYYLTPTEKDPRVATGVLGYLIHPAGIVFPVVFFLWHALKTI